MRQHPRPVPCREERDGLPTSSGRAWICGAISALRAIRATVYNTDPADSDHDGVGDACDAAYFAPLATAKLLVKHKGGDPSKRKVTLTAKGANIASPIAGDSNDPTVGGGMVLLQNPTTHVTAILNLPAVHWTGLGNPAGSKGYKYSDPGLVDGPCKKALLKPGKLFKALCAGSQIAFSLDQPHQQNLTVTATTGSGAQTLGDCMKFEGATMVIKDVPATPGKVGTFKAIGAPPAACPSS